MSLLLILLMISSIPSFCSPPITFSLYAALISYSTSKSTFVTHFVIGKGSTEPSPHSIVTSGQ